MVAFMADVTAVFATITSGIGVFLEPPLSYYVALGFAAAGVGVAKALIPRKRAK